MRVVLQPPDMVWVQQMEVNAVWGVSWCIVVRCRTPRYSSP